MTHPPKKPRLSTRPSRTVAAAETRLRAAQDPELSISTRFTEGYLQARAVSGGSELVPFLDAAGELDVYSVGTDAHVYQVQGVSGGTESWTETDLGISARQLHLYAGPDGDRDHPDVYGLDDQGRLTRSRYQGGAYAQQVNQPPAAKRSLTSWTATRSDVNATLYANVLFDDGEVGHGFQRSDGSWSAEDWVPMKESEGSSRNATAKRITMVANDPNSRSLFGIGTDDRVVFCELPNRFAWWTTVGSLRASDLSVIRDAEGRVHLFAVDTEHRLWTAAQKLASPGSPLAFGDWTPLSETTPLASTLPAIDFQGLLEVFAIGTDGLLYHLRQVPGALGPEWGTLFPFGNPVPNSVFAVGRSAAGYSVAFSVTVDNDLYRFWQNPISTQWYSYRVPLEEGGEMISVANHSTEITILDPAGVPVPGAEVRIRTSNLLNLGINGRSYVTSEFREAVVRANAAGMITILRPTNTLTAPIYGLSADFLEGEVYIYPNGSLQEKMHRTTAQEVLDAVGADGEPLLRGPLRTQENAEALAGITRQAMSLDMPSAAAGQRPLRYVSKSPSTRGLYYRPPGHQGRAFRLLEPRRVREQHWQVSFEGGNVRFRHLGRSEAAELVAAKRSAAARVLGVDWGDVWHSIGEGASRIGNTLQDFLVTTIVDPITGLVDEIRTVFTLVINGVEHLVDTVIAGFEQAFDIVQGVWRELGVLFDDLFAWLGALFAWDDIQRTARVFRHTLNQSLDFSVLALRSAAEQIEQGFEQIGSTVAAASQAFIEALGVDTLGGYSESYVPSDPQRVSNVGHNPLLNGFVDFGGDTVTGPPSAQVLARVEGPLDELVQQLVELTENFRFGEGKESFEAAVGYLRQIGEDPAHILQLSMAALVEVMEGIVQFALAAAAGVMTSIIELAAQLVEVVQALLNQEWEIPFVGDLFATVTGGLRLSPINLFSITIAVPGTMAYKVLRGEAPFPTDRSVEEFEEWFTAAWLAQQAGIAPEGARLSADELLRREALRASSAEVFTYLSSFLWLAQVAIDAPSVLFSATGVDNVNPAWGVASLASGFLGSALEIPWLYDADAGGISCANADEFGNMIWLLGVAFGPVRGALLNYVPGIPDQVDAYSSSLWGAVHLGLYIAQAVAAEELLSIGMVNNALQVTAPELLQLGSTPEVNSATSGVSGIALVMLIAFTYPVISALLLVDNAAGDTAAAFGAAAVPA